MTIRATSSSSSTNDNLLSQVSAIRTLPEALAAVKQSSAGLTKLDESLRSNREIVLAAVKQYGCALAHADEKQRGDREFVLTAVRQNGRALEYASTELQNDREIVLAAVQKDGRALKYANERFKTDEEIVRAAFAQYKSECGSMHEELILTLFCGEISQHGFACGHAKELEPDQSRSCQAIVKERAKITALLEGGQRRVEK